MAEYTFIDEEIKYDNKEQLDKKQSEQLDRTVEKWTIIVKDKILNDLEEYTHFNEQLDLFLCTDTVKVYTKWSDLKIDIIMILEMRLKEKLKSEYNIVVRIDPIILIANRLSVNVKLLSLNKIKYTN